MKKDVRNKGKTALHLAIETRKFSRAEILMNDFNAGIPPCTMQYLLLCVFLVDPSIADEEGKNCLCYAFECSAPTSLFARIKKV